MYQCLFCKKEIDEKTYKYSVNICEIPLCREHQTEEIVEIFTNKETKYRFGMIKGRIAETLIEQLFLSLGYDVFRYGMENTVPGIMKLLKGVRSNVANDIRRMPDFVVKKNDKVFFVEVKFRASENFSISDLPEEYPFENCYFIIVSKKHIKCITYDELKNKGEKITPEDKKYLGSRREFDLDKDRVIEFCDFAVKFFKEV